MVESARDSKEVAVYFYNKIGVKATPAMYAKTTKQAKSLLQAGYTKDEICNCLDYIVDIKKIDIYSLGYLSYNIKATLKELNAIESSKIAVKVKEQMQTINREVNTKDGSTNRNKEKAQNIGTQSRFGEKFTFDMHSTSRQNH